MPDKTRKSGPRRRRIDLTPGDLFVIEQSDGLFTVGQVVDCPNRSIATISLYAPRISSPDAAADYSLSTRGIISAVSSTSDQLRRAHWPIVGRRPVALERHRWPNEGTRAHKWVGMIVHGSGLICAFLEAFYGLAFWDDWYDPNYLDEYLIDGVNRPSGIKLKPRN